MTSKSFKKQKPLPTLTMLVFGILGFWWSNEYDQVNESYQTT